MAAAGDFPSPLGPPPTGIMVCFNCQRNMPQTATVHMYICRYCRFVNIALPNEFTAFIGSWIDASTAHLFKNSIVQYWDPASEELVATPSGLSGVDTEDMEAVPEEEESFDDTSEETEEVF